MLEELPKVEQEQDDIAFANQFAQAAELLVKSIQKARINMFKKAALIAKYDFMKKNVQDKALRALGGDSKDLDSVIDDLRDNFDNLFSEMYKLHPEILKMVQDHNKENKSRNKLPPGALPAHGRESMKAEDYFEKFVNPNKDEMKEKRERAGPRNGGNGGGNDNRGNRVFITNKTPIPVKVMSAEDGRGRGIFSFLNMNQGGGVGRRTTGRSIFGGNGRRIGPRPSPMSRGIANLMSGRSNIGGSLVDLPNIIAFGLTSMFGKALALAGGLLVTGLKVVFKLGFARIALLAVPLMFDYAKEGINNLMKTMFGEDSGITKAVKGILDSGVAKSAIEGGALGLAIGSFFGPKGMLIGFIVGSIGGMIKHWIDNDGPKKFAESATEMWTKINKGIDDLYNTISTSILNFFGGISEYFRKIFKPNQAEKIKDIDAKIEQNKKDISEWKEQVLDKPNLKWKHNIAKSNIEELEAKNKKLENERTTVKSDDTVEYEKSVRELGVMEERLKRPFRNESGKNAYLKQYNELKEKIQTQKVMPITQGNVPKLETPATSYLYNNMIDEKQTVAQKMMIPFSINAPTQYVNSSAVSNQISHNSVMQLSPLGYDGRIK